MNKIKDNKKSLSEIVDAIKNKFGIDLGYMHMVPSTTAVYNNGKPNKDIPLNQFGGSWTKNKKIYVNPDLKPVMDYYGISDISEDDFRRKIISHELGHEIYRNKSDKRLKKEILEKAKNLKTKYLDTVSKDKYKEELFAEYIADIIAGNKKVASYNPAFLKKFSKSASASKPIKMRKYSPNLRIRKKHGIKLEKPDVHFKAAAEKAIINKNIKPYEHLIGSLLAGGVLGSGAGALYTALKDKFDDDPYNDYYIDRKRWIKNILRGAGVGALALGGYNTYDNIRRNNLIHKYNQLASEINNLNKI